MNQTEIARATWELENNIQLDEIYKYDPNLYKENDKTKLWKNDPTYFKKAKISAAALLKMISHAKIGGTIEVMGLMLGKTIGDTMIVMDSFALPVEASETRVNAGDSANEYMSAFKHELEAIGRNENVIGWYHSHPTYKAWLSGIDVGTQEHHQRYFDPYLAVVIDPISSVSAGKVELGAFRTFPPGQKGGSSSSSSSSSSSLASSSFTSVPLGKAEDFGAHADKYYKLEVSYFKSSMDDSLLRLLWNKYWVHTLTSSPLVTNKDHFRSQMQDVADKLERVEPQILHGKGFSYGRHEGGGGGGGGSGLGGSRMKMGGGGGGGGGGGSHKEEEAATQLDKISQEGCRTTVEQLHALMKTVVKQSLFS